MRLRTRFEQRVVRLRLDREALPAKEEILMNEKSVKKIKIGAGLATGGVAALLISAILSRIATNLFLKGVTLNVYTAIVVCSSAIGLIGLVLALVGAILSAVGCAKLGKKEKPAPVVCPYCGVPNSPGSKFCETCGKPLVKRCVNCGTEIAPGEKFCKNCGVRVRDESDLKD